MPRFITKKWIEVHDQSGGTNNTNKQIRFKTPMLRSDLCDYNDVYIVVTGKITVTNPNNNSYDKTLAFKNNEPFISCVSKVNNPLIHDAYNLNFVTPLYNLLEYSKNYRKTTGSSWNYYRDEPNSGFNNNNRDTINYSIKCSGFINYKTSITGQLENDDEKKEDIKIAVPLQYLSNFWKTLNIPLINCEISLKLIWCKNCVLRSKATRNTLAAEGDTPAVSQISNQMDALFEITNCKLYVPMVTLSAENENKLLEQLKTGFKITVPWNKCRSEISNQTAHNNLNYLIDLTFTKVNRLFFISC